MKWLSVLLMACAAAAASAQDPGAPLTSGERAALARARQPDLEELRAGAAGGSDELRPEERAALRRAQAAAPDLEEMRAGELSDHEITIIAITAGAVLLLVLLL
ncbi:MAG: hypothetical protein EYC70_09755 [Planctomycetota bacterium]|nr:MAG: hypothetical protein EYC70_09755 [Planctomycetota bacterium]